MEFLIKFVVGIVTTFIFAAIQGFISMVLIDEYFVHINGFVDWFWVAFAAISMVGSALYLKDVRDILDD